jgi:hypothetical protein
MVEKKIKICENCNKTVKCPTSEKGKETKTSQCQTGCTEKKCHTFSVEVQKTCGGCRQIIAP